MEDHSDFIQSAAIESQDYPATRKSMQKTLSREGTCRALIENSKEEDEEEDQKNQKPMIKKISNSQIMQNN